MVSIRRTLLPIILTLFLCAGSQLALCGWGWMELWSPGGPRSYIFHSCPVCLDCRWYWSYRQPESSWWMCRCCSCLSWAEKEHRSLYIEFWRFPSIGWGRNRPSRMWHRWCIWEFVVGVSYPIFSLINNYNNYRIIWKLENKTKGQLYWLPPGASKFCLSDQQEWWKRIFIWIFIFEIFNNISIFWCVRSVYKFIIANSIICYYKLNTC